METIYEDRVSESNYYETPPTSSTIYKATQLRRMYRPRYSNRSVCAMRAKSNTSYGTIVTVMSLTIQIFVFVTTCYLLVTIEGKNDQACRVDGTKVRIDFKELDERLDQLNTNVNTLMNAITFTLPQVLNSNRGQVIQRINYLMHEIREIMKLNAMSLDVKMGMNKTLNFRTGSNSMRHPKFTTESPKVTTMRAHIPDDITLVPKIRGTAIPFYPLTKLKDDEIDNQVPSHDLNDDETAAAASKLFDYANMSPFF